MSEDTASNVLPFKLKAAPCGDDDLSRALNFREAQKLTALVFYAAHEMKTDVAEILEITQRVFGVSDLRYLPAKDFETVMNFLIGLAGSSAAAKH